MLFGASGELFWASPSSVLAPKELSGNSVGAPSGSLGAHNLLTGLINHDLGALWGPLGNLLTASLR